MFGLVPQRRRHVEGILGDEFFRNFFEFPGDTGFKVDIKDTKDSYVIQAEIPGVSKEGINLEVDNDYLVISVVHDSAEEEEKENYIRKERRVSSSRRRFYIGDLNPDQIQANYNHGVLEVTLPKAEPRKESRRMIDIH